MNTSFSFCIITYGCKVNQYESESIREYWISLGGVEIPPRVLQDQIRSGKCAERPDIILISGCAVTAGGVSDARQIARKVRSCFSGAKVIITGCAATAEPGDFVSVSCETILPQTAKWNILNTHPMQVLESNCRSFQKMEQQYPPFRINAFARTRPVLKVQDGCSHRCTYCIVPLTRGPARSRPSDECVSEAAGLLQAGHREIMISGINLRQYFHDRLNFWGLLRKLDKALSSDWKGKARLRISSLDPAQLTEEGFDALAECELVCPHVHLSLQSGSDTVLKRMGRSHYASHGVFSAVERLQRIFPVMGLGADILVGFPGETETEFSESLELIRSLPLTYAHVFPYSERPGTPAARMPGSVPVELRRERAAAVRAVVEKKKAAFALELLKQPEFSVIVDQDGSGDHGPNEYYVQCVIPGTSSGKGLLKVRPVACDEGRIIAEPI